MYADKQRTNCIKDTSLLDRGKGNLTCQ